MIVFIHQVILNSLCATFKSWKLLKASLYKIAKALLTVTLLDIYFSELHLHEFTTFHHKYSHISKQKIHVLATLLLELID